MRVLGFIASHYMGDYGKECLLSLRDYCDKVYICHSKGTSHGFPAITDPPETSYEIHKLAKEVLGSKLIWEEYSGFHNEQDHRNMKYRHTTGYAYCISADYDEYLDNIPEAINYAENHSERFYGTGNYINFVKGLEYFVSDSKNAPIRLEKLTENNADQNFELPLIVYHTSLAQSTEIMSYKKTVFGHRDEVLPDFYSKWVSWTPESSITGLHPTDPTLWIKPEKFLGEFPEPLKNHNQKIKEKMKILLIPLDYFRHKESLELFTDMVESFSKVAETYLYQGDFILAIDFKPDLILFQGSMSEWELGELKDATKALVCMISGDARYAPMQSFMEYRNVADAYLLPFSGKLLDTYITLLGKPCHFLWEFIQNWRFKEPKMMDEGIVSFVGNIYVHLPGGDGRCDMINFIKGNGVNINCFGNGFPEGTIDNELVPDVYNSSYIVIAENNHIIDDYFTPRNIGGLAAGTCTLMKYFPGIEKFFQNLVHCIYYSDKYELLQWIEFLKVNPTIRNNIASQGYGLAKTNFTMNNWVSEFIKIINKHYIK